MNFDKILYIQKQLNKVFAMIEPGKLEEYNKIKKEVMAILEEEVM